MKKILIAGNWKMHTNVFEAEKLVEYFVSAIDKLDINFDILVCPPFTNLAIVKQTIGESIIKLGAQNCHYEFQGAYTGEISVSMLKDIGCEYVIIGHSERRSIFDETNELINKKVKAVIEHDITPILCIGETLGERNAGKTYEILTHQISEGFKNIDIKDLEKIVIAYEPVWAIGTGISATTEQAQEAHFWTRNFIVKKYSTSLSEILILYGGSMNEKNAKELLSQPDVNGGLIGGASIKPESFISIINSAIEISK
jgi:triosephosphate isomerase